MDTNQRSPVGSNNNREAEFEELISKLPRAPAGIFRWSFRMYKDFWFHQYHLEGTLCAQQRFVAQPEDIILCSFPKTGTTWLKALAFATTTRTQFNVESATHPLLTKSPHECVPVLELETERILNSPQRFRIVSTHAPYSLLPESVQSSTCKIVYVWRDPKDMFISLLHFVSGLKLGKEYLDMNGVPVDEAFSQFIDGPFPYGPYWDHVTEFLKASRERLDKLLCLRYEDLANETCDSVRRLAEFISQPLSPEEEERGVVEKIVDLCNFENLRSSAANRRGDYRSDDGKLVIPNTLFYRRGEVGDWKNHLSDDMAARLDSIFQEKFAEAGLKLPD